MKNCEHLNEQSECIECVIIDAEARGFERGIKTAIAILEVPTEMRYASPARLSMLKQVQALLSKPEEKTSCLNEILDLVSAEEKDKPVFTGESMCYQCGCVEDDGSLYYCEVHSK